jgi:SMI1/KNR4 family protein SUKH-1
MNPIVEQAVIDYLAKTKTGGRPGKAISLAEMKDLQSRLSSPLPAWYAELLLKYPLSGTYLNYPIQTPGNSHEAYDTLQLANAKSICNQTEEYYPDLAIRDLGYVCFATDPTGSGNPYFIKIAQGDNPPVYLVYHDVSQIGTVVEKEGMIMIAGSLAEFFHNAMPNSYNNPFEDKE